MFRVRVSLLSLVVAKGSRLYLYPKDMVAIFVLFQFHRSLCHILARTVVSQTSARMVESAGNGMCESLVYRRLITK